MTDCSSELETLYQTIMSAEAGDRVQFQRKLAQLIDRAIAHGECVRTEIRLLNEELVNEAIESQFDNMPV